MEIIIQGTKGGYKILFQTLKVPSSVARDVRPITNNESPVGQSAYSIAFAANGYVFTKYVIVRDMRRSMSVGNIAFSVFNAHNEKLSGNYVRELLDKLSVEYCQKYIVNNNLDNVIEDWSFVHTAINNYERELEKVPLTYAENYPTGTADAAFVYYSSDAELEKYFDNPNQNEYCEYKQIFFVNKELEGKPENPLNALRHNPASDLTGKIDIENPEYKLLFDEYTKDGGKIVVRVDGNTRNNNSTIRRKDKLEITYSKRYYVTKSVEGEWYRLSADFVEVNNYERTITIKETELSPELLVVTLKIIDKEGNTIFDPEIICERYYQDQQVPEPKKYKISGNEIKFQGENRNKWWIVTAKKDNFESHRRFVPEECRNVELVLEEYKTIKNNTQGKNEDKKTRGFYGTLFERAESKKLYIVLIIIAIIAVIEIIIIATIVIIDYNNPVNETYNTDYIKQYAEGTELNLDELNEFKSQYCRNTNNPPMENKNWWQQLLQWIFGLNLENEPRETTSPDYCTKIETAIDIRNSIINGKIDNLKILQYSSEQSFFKKTVNGIDDRFKDKIGNTMRACNPIDKMKLNDVNDFITNLQKLLIIREEIKNRSNDTDLNKKIYEVDRIYFPVDSISANIKKQIDDQKDRLIEKSKKGKKKEEAKKNNLSGKKGTKTDRSKMTITQESDLENRFFELIHAERIDLLKKIEFDKLSELSKNSENKTTQEIYDFLYKYCDKTISYRDFRDKLAKIPKLDRKKIKTLTELENKLK